MAGAFSKVLIANRGEIACRIIRTARRLGIGTVAVYSDVDAHSLHVSQADESRWIGPAAPTESYLNTERVIDAALDSGAEAIHPGYGFLSENPEFAQAVADAGLTLIGPPVAAMRQMGPKDTAKRIMAEAGVPVVPGWSESHGSEADLRAIASEIGYPVLIKPVDGGGGKGMLAVHAEAEFDRKLEQARRESRSAFGSDRILLEKLIENPRHVEVQIFGDRAGNVVHLFERDCSTQRRRQKIIEESPAPGISEEFRTALCSAAVAAGKAIGYEGAGTVEFIADGSQGLQPDSFWFLEMNTRLQVEHPVTEEVTGVDLVEWQFRVAAGEDIPLQQSEIRLSGHSVEARVYAEDTCRDFLPAPGILTRLEFPDGIRVETGFGSGDRIPSQYDPMIAKVIATGESRDAAVKKLGEALSRTALSGTASNVPLLLAVLNSDRFTTGTVDTAWVEDVLLPRTAQDAPPADALALAALELSGVGSGLSGLAGFRIWGNAEWDVLLGFGTSRQRVAIRLGGHQTAIVQVAETMLTCRLDQSGWRVDGTDAQPFVCSFDGKAFVLSEGMWEFQFVDSEAAPGTVSAAGPEVLAPLPGVVSRLLVEQGQPVEAGDPIAAIEAMKMEHMLAAPRNGTVEAVLVSENDQVSEGAVIVLLNDLGDGE